jgi:hypothetical protein
VQITKGNINSPPYSPNDEKDGGKHVGKKVINNFGNEYIHGAYRVVCHILTPGSDRAQTAVQGIDEDMQHLESNNQKEKVRYVRDGSCPEHHTDEETEYQSLYNRFDNHPDNSNIRFIALDCELLADESGDQQVFGDNR